MGSQLAKNFDVDQNPAFHSGPGSIYRVHNAKRKQAPYQEVSVFFFDKKQMNKSTSVQQKEEIYNTIKIDATGLSKLKHPQILNLLEQPLEDKNTLVFVTERVNKVLSEDQSMSEIELKHLFIQILEVLHFLHSTAKTIHCALSPENMYLCPNGSLKLGGFHFSKMIGESEVDFQFDYKKVFKEIAIHPNLNFSSPEIVLNGKINQQSDIFSLGAVLFYLYNKHKNEANILKAEDKYTYEQQFTQFERNFNSQMQQFEQSLQNLFRMMLLKEPLRRSGLNELVESQWVQDPLIKALKYLEKIHEKNEAQKIQFLGGLMKIVEKYDKVILLNKVIPLLCEAWKDQKLASPVLTIMFKILKDDQITQNDFQSALYQRLKEYCQSKEMHAAALFILISNFDVLTKFIKEQDFQDFVLPLALKSLECDIPKLQTIALDQVGIILSKLPYQVLKSQVLPRVLHILEKSKDVDLKIKVMKTVDGFFDKLDKETVTTQIVKSLEILRKIESNGKICMLILSMYERCCKMLTVEDIGMKVLPGLIPILVTAQVNTQEFSVVLDSIRKMLNQVEVHRIQQIKQAEQEPVQQDNVIADSQFGDMFGNDKISDDPFAFMNGLDGGQTTNKQSTPIVSQPNMFGGNTSDPFSGGLTQNQDPFGGISQPQAAPFGQISQPNTVPFGGISQAKADPFIGQINNNQDPFSGISNAPNSDPFAGISTQSNQFGMSTQQNQEPFPGISTSQNQFGIPNQQNLDPFIGIQTSSNQFSGVSTKQNYGVSTSQNNQDLFGGLSTGQNQGGNITNPNANNVFQAPQTQNPFDFVQPNQSQKYDAFNDVNLDNQLNQNNTQQFAPQQMSTQPMFNNPQMNQFGAGVSQQQQNQLSSLFGNQQQTQQFGQMNPPVANKFEEDFFKQFNL